MIIVLKPLATDDHLASLRAILRQRGFDVHISKGVETTIVGCIGVMDAEKKDLADQLSALPYVDKVVIVSRPYKLVGRAFAPEGTQIRVGSVTIGGPEVVCMAGPCTIESEEQLRETALAVHAAGARVLRGGAFKPSTSPYSFHGLGEAGLRLLRSVGDELGMPVITEVMDTRDVDLVCRYTDILQVGTRNMANFSLLQELGRAGKPVMLKRGWASQIEEWMQAAEYIASQGNYQIILCERGIRTFETYTRNTFDINAVAVAKEISHLPVIADPSHATGRSSLVGAVSRAAIAAGADGVIVEVHPRPETAVKDGAQSLTFDAFTQLMEQLHAVALAVGRQVGAG